MPLDISSAVVDAAGALARPHAPLAAWTLEVAELTRPEAIRWCESSTAAYERLAQLQVDADALTLLGAADRPNSHLARSEPGDVPRVRDRPLTCSRSETEGPASNRHDPVEMRHRRSGLFEGSTRERRMLVVPLSIGSPGSAASQIGVQMTGSPGVVCSMRIMIRVSRRRLNVPESDPQTLWCSAGLPGRAACRRSARAARTAGAELSSGKSVSSRKACRRHRGLVRRAQRW